MKTFAELKTMNDIQLTFALSVIIKMAKGDTFEDAVEATRASLLFWAGHKEVKYQEWVKAAAVEIPALVTEMLGLEG